MVLVIDDSVDVIRLLAALLGRRAEVIFATSGAQGLELARRRLPDLILLDVQMPGMDGHHVRQALQDDALMRAIPVVFVSADDPAEVPGPESVAWLRKPFQPADVYRTLGAFLPAPAAS